MTLTPEDVAKYCPEFRNEPIYGEDRYFLTSTEEGEEEEDEPSEYWIETSAVKLIIQARKERDVLKQALEEIKENTSYDAGDLTIDASDMYVETDEDRRLISETRYQHSPLKLDKFIDKALASITACSPSASEDKPPC